jgi:hypothetical protein
LSGCRKLAVDATGVGRPVVEMLKFARLGCRLRAVTITGAESESYVDDYYHVPKRHLVTGMQMLLQRGGVCDKLAVPAFPL